MNHKSKPYIFHHHPSNGNSWKIFGLLVRRDSTCFYLSFQCKFMYLQLYIRKYLFYFLLENTIYASQARVKATLGRPRIFSFKTLTSCDLHFFVCFLYLIWGLVLNNLSDHHLVSKPKQYAFLIQHILDPKYQINISTICNLDQKNN